MRAVVKVGTSSITGESGELDDAALVKLCGEIATARRAGHEVVLVCSGAIAAGLPPLHLSARPIDVGTLQAIAAVGQPRLMERIGAILAEHDLVVGQVLLTPHDFGQRSQYLHARETLRRLLDLGVVPVVNENDTIADDEIRYGDNDRLAALVSHMVAAELLVLLTDTAGLFTADPRLDERASLIEEIVEVDAALESVAGGAGTARGSGGMASKLAAAKIAAWSGVRVVIAAAEAPDVVARRDQRAGRRHSGAAAAGTSLEPEALDRVRPARERPDRRRLRGAARAHRAGALAPARGGARGRRRVRRRRRGRSRGRRRSRSRRAWCATPHPGCGQPRAGGRATSPRAPPTRSSTATTSWCSPPDRALGNPPSPLRWRVTSDTLSITRRRRSTGGGPQSRHLGGGSGLQTTDASRGARGLRRRLVRNGAASAHPLSRPFSHVENQGPQVHLGSDPGWT